MLFVALTGFAALLVLAAVMVIVVFARLRVTDQILGEQEMVNEAMTHALRVVRARSIGRAGEESSDSLKARLLKL